MKYIIHKYLPGGAWGEVHYTQVPVGRGLGLSILHKCTCSEELGVECITHKYFQGDAGGEVHYNTSTCREYLKPPGARAVG